MTDISSYMGLIQYKGPRQPTREVLHELHVRHSRYIPFENLSPFTGMAVDLDIHSIMDKFARQRRGGYCYEHNALFQYILQNMGFTVTGLRSEERRVGKRGVSTGRSRWMPCNKKKKKK